MWQMSLDSPPVGDVEKQAEKEQRKKKKKKSLPVCAFWVSLRYFKLKLARCFDQVDQNAELWLSCRKMVLTICIVSFSKAGLRG